MSGYVFISYDHEHDVSYVDALADQLTAAGLSVWYDRGPMTDGRWTDVVAPQLDGCGAVVVVMTPEADRSEWVFREFDRAMRVGKPISPLLVRGEPFLALAGLPHDDATGGGRPGLAWVERIRATLGAGAQPGATAMPLEGGRTAEALGIEVKGGMFVPLIDRGTAVPCQRNEIFTTAEDGQSQIKVTVYRGNSGMVAQNQRVGVFEVRVPNPGARGTANIAITFDIDTRGAFRLLAMDQRTGLPAPVKTVG
jgi:hypothetical protein